MNITLTSDMKMREGAVVAVRGLGLRSRDPSAAHRCVVAGECFVKINVDMCERCGRSITDIYAQYSRLYEV